MYMSVYAAQKSLKVLTLLQSPPVLSLNLASSRDRTYRLAGVRCENGLLTIVKLSLAQAVDEVLVVCNANQPKIFSARSARLLSCQLHPQVRSYSLYQDLGRGFVQGKNAAIDT